MSDNVQKYENWRAITESDYVTMFIKTWFAFVATLRELYPKENLEEVIGKGDKAFLNPYLNDFQNKYYYYNNFNIVKENILKVYELGRNFTLKYKKYNRFFSEDFYYLNKGYFWTQRTEDYEVIIKYASDINIFLHAKFLDNDLYVDGVPLIISETIDIYDIISSSKLSDLQITNCLDDESAYISLITTEVRDRVSKSFIDRITKGDYKSKFSAKILAKLNSTALAINASIVNELALMKETNINKEEVLFSQLPCANFIYKLKDNKAIPDIDAYKWFLNFVYFMRNALFHEIIDPLNSFWQEIFKHSYLALKEILDGNINYFIEQDAIISKMHTRVWEEMSEKPDIYIPNFNEEYDNGDIEFTINEYDVSETNIKLKAAVEFIYWFDDHSKKRMKAKCNAELSKATRDITRFKMTREEFADVNT